MACVSVFHGRTYKIFIQEYPPVANPNTILTLTLTLTWGLILDNALILQAAHSCDVQLAFWAKLHGETVELVKTQIFQEGDNFSLGKFLGIL